MCERRSIVSEAVILDGFLNKIIHLWPNKKARQIILISQLSADIQQLLGRSAAEWMQSVSRVEIIALKHYWDTKI